MESPSHFDLDQAIAAWRDELAAQHGLAPDDVRILEAHLRDGVAELRRAGRTEEEAFAQARGQVGPPAAVAKEFAKAGNWQLWLMKRWVALTVLLYAVALVLLTLPALFIGLGSWGTNNTLHDALEIYQYWGYWAWVGVLAAGQALFLLLPLNIASRRLRARRPLKLPVITGAFFLAILCIAGVICIFCAANKDMKGDFFEWFDPFTSQVNPNDDSSGGGGIISITLLFWLVWTLVFLRFARTDSPPALLKRLVSWLLRGSILELLVAVPSHVIVRRRDDCCAPIVTFWGITVGISVMLLCFGPGVFFLFVDRCKRLKSKSRKNPIAE